MRIFKSKKAQETLVERYGVDVIIGLLLLAVCLLVIYLLSKGNQIRCNGIVQAFVGHFEATCA